jgi:tetratricopeptide (TPR) repeat protein
MDAGEVYPESIRSALEQVRVLVLLIGPEWLAVEAGTTVRLVDRDGDWVRREIRRALERDIVIIPVLLDGTPLPAPDMLPDDIRDLVRRQALEVRHRSLRTDLTRLGDVVNRWLMNRVDHDVRAEDTASAPSSPVLVGAPPTVPPNWFQDRTAEVEDIERHLGDARTGLVTVRGPVGFGKTAMVHRLWERIRAGSSHLHVHGMVYLSARGFEPVTAPRVVERLLDLFPRHEADRLGAGLRQHLPPTEKLDVMLAALAGRQVVVAIDAVEELLDDHEDIEESALRELVDHLVPRAEQGVRLLLVGRRAAEAVTRRFPGMTYQRNLDEGLPDPDSFALLQAVLAETDAARAQELDAVPDHDRARLHRLTGGSPRTLELTSGVFASGDSSFTQLLEFMARSDSEGMAVHLLSHLYDRLSSRKRRVLHALAVYHRPVLPEAVDHLIEAPDLDARAVLGRLSRLRLVQPDGEHFGVSAPDEREFLLGKLRHAVGGDVHETPKAITRRAADYFLGQHHSNPESLADLGHHLIEIELRLEAGDYEKAFACMGAVDDTYLSRWGSGSALESSLRRLLRSHGVPQDLEIDAESMLGRMLMQQERYREAAECLQHALDLAADRGMRGRLIVLHEQLAGAYLQLNHLRQATMHSRQACRGALSRLRIRHAVTALADLDMCLARAGAFPRVRRPYALARGLLKIMRSSAEEAQRPMMQYCEGWIYSQLGERGRARRLLEDGRSRAVKLGDRRMEGRCLLGEAELALDDGNPEHAVARARDASAIGVRNGDRALCRNAMEILAKALLVRNDLDGAARAADIAQRNPGSMLGFGLAGLAAYRRGEKEDARSAFYKGYTQGRQHRANEGDFQFLDEYGLVVSGLVLLGDRSHLATALNAFRAARKITDAAGAVARTQTLLRQFEPHADATMLDRIRAAAKGERRDSASQQDDGQHDD